MDVLVQCTVQIAFQLVVESTAVVVSQTASRHLQNEDETNENSEEDENATVLLASADASRPAEECDKDANGDAQRSEALPAGATRLYNHQRCIVISLLDPGVDTETQHDYSQNEEQKVEEDHKILQQFSATFNHLASCLNDY